MSFGSSDFGQPMSFHSRLGEKRSINSRTWAMAYSRYSLESGIAWIIASRLSIGGGENVQSRPPE